MNNNNENRQERRVDLVMKEFEETEKTFNDGMRNLGLELEKFLKSEQGQSLSKEDRKMVSELCAELKAAQTQSSLMLGDFSQGYDIFARESVSSSREKNFTDYEQSLAPIVFKQEAYIALYGRIDSMAE